VVNRRLALLDACFILVATAIEAAGLLNQFTPLVLLGNGPYTSALSSSQLQALASLPGDLASIDYTIHTVFFGLDILIFAYLVLRSTFPGPSASVGHRRPGVSLLQLHRHPGPGSGSPPGSLDPAARPGW
jgi:hypothetical protein